MKQSRCAVAVLGVVVAAFVGACSSASTGGTTADGGAGTSSSGDAASGTSAFVGTWLVAGLVASSDCTDDIPDETVADSRTITVTAGGPGLIAKGPNCTFDETVSGDTATLNA